ncbi:adhesive plaque matrix protein 2-like [Contarinia nasturtii]|uniref:adhesive plaque matrix protein 2-like n=1 Tax=Contarinia nasturtii TaxID=265458 RepID=UPI0012D37EB8|nr:adhesive plaque matrix protein 2-like [Contarinia nasturtii]
MSMKYLCVLLLLSVSVRAAPTQDDVDHQVKETPINPCLPSPCGANSICHGKNDTASCECLPEYSGNPYEGCRLECELSIHCDANLACIRKKCVDPCLGVCGSNADCQVVKHTPNCVCRPGFTGDSYRYCSPIDGYDEHLDKVKKDNCHPSPCAQNAQCNNGVCSCLPGMQGDPYTLCKHECYLNSDCLRDNACIRNKCVNPCESTRCAENANCYVYNHLPVCVCPSGTEGNPYQHCTKIGQNEPLPPVVIGGCRQYPCGNNSLCTKSNVDSTAQSPLKDDYLDSCLRDPCGPYSECRPNGDCYICNCLPDFIGQPPNCKPECVLSADCGLQEACVNRKCVDPCTLDVCGTNAECKVKKHTPSCRCGNGFSGDPFISCNPIPPPQDEIPVDKSNPIPCAQNAERIDGICTCLHGLQGDPYDTCSPETTILPD